MNKTIFRDLIYVLNCVLRLLNVSSAQYNNTNANISEVCKTHGPVQLMVKNYMLSLDQLLPSVRMCVLKFMSVQIRAKA